MSYRKRGSMKASLAIGRGLAAGAGLMVVLAAVGTVAWERLTAPSPPTEQQRQREQTATPSGMVYVPGGTFLKGSNDEDADEEDRPLRSVYVPSFYIDRTEVTNRDFARFRPDHAFLKGEEDLPATNVTYDEAAAYAKWAGKRLPTDEEWEKAARGTDGRRYPWGNAWNPKRVAARKPSLHSPFAPPETLLDRKPANACASGPSRVRPVGSVVSGVSPYGCVDMAGNAWEWVQGFYQNNPSQRLLRGGAVGYGERACRTYTRAIEGAGDT